MSNVRAANRFAISLAKKRDGIKQRSKTEIVKILNNLLTKIVLQTPVDTGVARANWNISIGSPNLNFSKDNKDKSGDRTLQEAQNTVANLVIGDTVYIVNATKYIRRLEEGHSKQAPAGWVRIAIQQLQRRLT